MNTSNLSTDSLSEIIVDAILNEPYLNKDKLTPLVRSLLKGFIKKLDDKLSLIKDKPVAESKDQSRIVALNRRDIEKKYWMHIVRVLDAENMEKHYNGLTEELIKNGHKI